MEKKIRIRNNHGVIRNITISTRRPRIKKTNEEAMFYYFWGEIRSRIASFHNINNWAGIMLKFKKRWKSEEDFYRDKKFFKNKDNKFIFGVGYHLGVNACYREVIIPFIKDLTKDIKNINVRAYAKRLARFEASQRAEYLKLNKPKKFPRPIPPTPQEQGLIDMMVAIPWRTRGKGREKIRPQIDISDKLKILNVHNEHKTLKRIAEETGLSIDKIKDICYRQKAGNRKYYVDKNALGEEILLYRDKKINLP